MLIMPRLGNKQACLIIARGRAGGEKYKQEKHYVKCSTISCDIHHNRFMVYSKGVTQRDEGTVVMQTDALLKVVIIGAGFGGLYAARTLMRKPVDVLVIDKNNFHTFTP